MIQNGKYYVELSLRKLISPLSAVRLGVTDFPAANEKKNYFFFHVLQSALRAPLLCKLFDLLELKKFKIYEILRVNQTIPCLSFRPHFTITQ